MLYLVSVKQFAKDNWTKICHSRRNYCVVEFCKVLSAFGTVLFMHMHSDFVVYYYEYNNRFRIKFENYKYVKECIVY